MYGGVDLLKLHYTKLMPLPAHWRKEILQYRANSFQFQMKMCPFPPTHTCRQDFFQWRMHDPLEATNLKSRFMSYLVASIATGTKCVLHHYYHVCVHSLDCFRGVATPATPPLDPALLLMPSFIMPIDFNSFKVNSISTGSRYLVPRLSSDCIWQFKFNHASMP